MSMNKATIATAFLFALVGAATGVPSASAQAAGQASSGPTADQVATRVQNFYNQTRTFQAEFKQEYFVKAHNQRKVDEGRVIFEKPGKMSWTYPNGNRVVSDGHTLKSYQRENQQMFE